MFKNIKKIIKILDSHQKKKFNYLILLMFVAMILETASIASLLPLISYFSEGNQLTNFNIKIFENLDVNLSNSKNLIMILILSIFILKNFYLALYYFLDSKFVYNVRFTLGVSLFKKYLNNSYLFHVQNNSAKLKERITGSCSAYGSALAGLSQLICEGLIVLGLLTFLIIIKPQETGIVIFIGLILSLSFYLILKSRIYRLGKKRIIANTDYIKSMSQGFEAIKDIMIFKSQKEFIKDFQNNSQNIEKVGFVMHFINRIPKIWFEISIVVILIILFFFISTNNESNKSGIETIGIFLIVALRILPSINKIIHSLQNIKFSEPTVNNLEDDLKKNNLEIADKSKEAIKKNKISFNKKIEFKNVDFDYANTNKKILKNINFSINKNDFVAIIGETGSGKSTLIDLITGLIKPNSGTIEADGVSISENFDLWINHIGYVPQNVYLTDDTIEKNISFGLKDTEIDLRKIENSLKNAQLNNFISNLEKGIKTTVGERAVQISGGERQRIGIARALYRNPDILLFDEATSALDTKTENNFFNTLNEIKKNKTIIFITHRKSNLELFDKVFLIENKTLKELTKN
jgi:ATP-binding cassette, subfamily B, bacterial PglK